MSNVSKNRTSEAYNSHFPTVLRELIRKKGVTQEKFAQSINVNRQTIGQWKDGITAPDIYALKKISEKYHISADYLLGLTNSPSINEDIRVINAMTGLNDEAISNLIRIKEMDSQSIASKIISSEYFIDLLNILEEIEFETAQYYESIERFSKKFQEADKKDAQLMLQVNWLDTHASLPSRYLKSIEHNNIELHVTKYINFLRHELNTVFANIINDILGTGKSMRDYDMEFVERAIDLIGDSDNEKTVLLVKTLTDKYKTKMKEKELSIWEEMAACDEDEINKAKARLQELVTKYGGSEGND